MPVQIKEQEMDPSLKVSKPTLNDHFFCKHIKDKGLEKSCRKVKQGVK